MSATLGALAMVLVVACGQESSSVAASVTLNSKAFSSGGAIPNQFTCSGADVSPPLSWSGAPSGTKSLALTVIDPDAPSKHFVHWVLFNVPPGTSQLPEGGPPPPGSVQGRNDFGSTGYRGPCPPPGGPHHYHFKVYALDTVLSLPAGASETSFEGASQGHVLASGELIGTFKR